MKVGDFPFRLVREGLLMSPDPDDPLEAEGVLNPAAGWADGQLYLLPRMVSAGNVSRVGLARVEIADGRPVGVTRLGVVLEPDMTWERGPFNSGVEDPRITWLPLLGLHVMTYVAYGPVGPRTALAVSPNLRDWRRLGPVAYRWDERAEVDLNLYHNKDALFLPEPVIAPDGEPSFAVLHRPMGILNPDTSIADLPDAKPPTGPVGGEAIWISFIPVAEVQRDPGALTVWRGHRFVAAPEYPWEELKIGGGTPPIRVPEGWLLLHHGVTGRFDPSRILQQYVHYATGGLILDAEQPWRVLARSAEPILQADTAAGAERRRPERRLPDGHRRHRGRVLRLLWHGGLQHRGRPTCEELNMTHPRRLITFLVLLALTLSGLAGARPAVADVGTLANMGHLDFLLDRLEPAPAAGHDTYRLDSEPELLMPWTYADARDNGQFARVGGGTYDPATATIPRAPTTPTTWRGRPWSTCDTGSRPAPVTAGPRPTNCCARWRTCRPPPARTAVVPCCGSRPTAS